MKEGKNPKMNYSLTQLTNAKILAAVEKAKSDVKRAIEKLGMDKLLCKYNAWDSPKEVTSVESDYSDSDDDGDNENNDNHPNEDDHSHVLSSVIQEICDDEPIQIATDIEIL